MTSKKDSMSNWISWSRIINHFNLFFVVHVINFWSKMTEIEDGNLNEIINHIYGIYEEKTNMTRR